MSEQNLMMYREIGERLAHELHVNGDGHIRMDAGNGRVRFVKADAEVATAFAARELEYVKSKTYDIKKHALKARTFLPVTHDTPAGAEDIRSESWDAFGEAEIVTDYAKDSPRVDVDKDSFTNRVLPLRDSYGYSVQDLRRIAMTGSRLNVARANQARRGIEVKLDRLAARGEPRLGRTGFINDPNVNVFGTAMTLDGVTPAANIRAFLNAVASQVGVESNHAEMIDTLLFAPSAFQVVSAISFGADTKESLLEVWLEKNPFGIKRIDQWLELEGAGVGGLDRIVGYRYDPDVAEIDISLEYTEHPPERKGLEWVVECELRSAGTIVRYPGAMIYADVTANPLDITA